MRIAVRLSEDQKEEWLSKPQPPDVDIQFVKAGESLSAVIAEIYFDLLFDIDVSADYKGKPVFVNAVAALLSELPANYIRINAWSGFLKREIVEVAASGTNVLIVQNVLERLGWKYILSPDIRGMIVVRTIAMLINEAFFAHEDGVSSKNEIDIAMKLGTGYPYGPFEWAEKIGLTRIYMLLKMLSEEHERYTVSLSLKDAATLQ